MKQPIATTCAIALSLLLSAMAQNNRTTQHAPTHPSSNIPTLVDPGFESFTLARNPISGWYSDELASPKDPRIADVMMTPDSQIKVEGQYSLRIEQFRPRPKGRGQAFLSQAVRLPKGDGLPRSFDLAAQMRGGLNGPVTIDIYVWEAGTIARAIARRNVKVNKEWTTTTVSFRVPNGHDVFGVWFYLPRDDEAQLWLDDIRLTPRAK